MTSSQKHSLGWFITILGLSIVDLVFWDNMEIVMASGVEGAILLCIVATILYPDDWSDGEPHMVYNTITGMILGSAMGVAWGFLLRGLLQVMGLL